MDVKLSQWNDWRIITIEGEFVVKHLMKVRGQIEMLDAANCAKIAINLENMTYIDSSAITLIINYHKRIKSKNGRMVIFGASEDAKGIFSIVGLDDSIALYNSMEEFQKGEGA